MDGFPPDLPNGKLPLTSGSTVVSVTIKRLQSIRTLGRYLRVSQYRQSTFALVPGQQTLRYNLTSGPARKGPSALARFSRLFNSSFVFLFHFERDDIDTGGEKINRWIGGGDR